MPNIVHIFIHRYHFLWLHMIQIVTEIWMNPEWVSGDNGKEIHQDRAEQTLTGQKEGKTTPRAKQSTEEGEERGEHLHKTSVCQ